MSHTANYAPQGKTSPLNKKEPAFEKFCKYAKFPIPDACLLVIDISRELYPEELNWEKIESTDI